MFLSSSLITLALALVAAAGPIPHVPHVHPVLPRGASVPGSGVHCAVKTADGQFTLEGAVAHLNRTMNKYRQSLINLQNNGGTLDEGVIVMPMRPVAHTTSLTKRQSEALTDQEGGLEWTGVVSVGTPAQNFVIDFDTGSSDFWVPLTDCQTCAGKTLFDPSKSSSLKALNGNFSISYGDGSTASGLPFQDNALIRDKTIPVSLGGINVNNQIFAGAEVLTGNLVQTPGDGLMGLAFPAISNLGVNNTLFDAFAQGQIPQPQFSFKLAETGSSLFIGGQDPSLFTGATEFHPLSSGMGFWQIGNTTAKLGGVPAVSNFDAIIDSGTTLIVGPPQEVSTFYSQIPGAQLADPQSGFFTVPCSANVPSLAFNWGGKDWTVDPSLFNLGPISQGSSQCALAIVGSDTGLGDNTWILGDTFMQNVYSTFDFGQFAVGFSQLSQGGPASSSSSNSSSTVGTGSTPPTTPAAAPCPCNCTGSASPAA
ncbi:hypothetical protein Clacol_008270 [Clathrus columnatus]|uniref:Peptidase A1 domain-containing protein n=1 Tax=Clathrus columnatus TaxID=1419009 RepID=A0AAV5AKJ4_9AGAM|nr:hypothetical protein Clacol_008270 [Clathrus columnatus]